MDMGLFPARDRLGQVVGEVEDFQLEFWISFLNGRRSQRYRPDKDQLRVHGYAYRLVAVFEDADRCSVEHLHIL